MSTWTNNTGRNITLNYTFWNGDVYAYSFLHCYPPGEGCHSYNQIDDEIIGETQTGTFIVPAGYIVHIESYADYTEHSCTFVEP